MVVGSTNQVRTGNYIQAINFELNWNVEGNITTVVDWYFLKDVGSFISTAAGFVSPAATGVVTDDQRRYRLMEGMEMPAGINNAGAVKRQGTLLIPQHLQRMGKGDRWYLVYVVAAAGNIVDACGKFIYKTKKP